jgi:hypothetical protein
LEAWVDELVRREVEEQRGVALRDHQQLWAFRMHFHTEDPKPLVVTAAAAAAAATAAAATTAGNTCPRLVHVDGLVHVVERICVIRHRSAHLQNKRRGRKEC